MSIRISQLKFSKFSVSAVYLSVIVQFWVTVLLAISSLRFGRFRMVRGSTRRIKNTKKELVIFKVKLFIFVV